MHFQKGHSALAWGVGLLILGLLAGCGGSKSSPATTGAAGNTGSAVITIQWPQAAKSRLIPDNTQSIVIRVYSGTQKVSEQVVPKPTGATQSEIRITNLPTGPVLFVIEAHSDTAGLSQPPLATGSTTTTIEPGVVTPVEITLTPSAAAGSSAAPTGFVLVTVTNVPLVQGSNTLTLKVQAYQNGQALTAAGSSLTVPLTSAVPATAVPLRLGPVPAVPVLFVATVTDANNAIVASGSAIQTPSTSQDVSLTIPLAAGTAGGNTGGQGNVTTATLDLTVNSIPNDATKLAIVVYDGAGNLLTDRGLSLDQAVGLTTRRLLLTLPGGGVYTVVAAAYLAAPAGLTNPPTSVPPGAEAVGSATAKVDTGASAAVNVDLRLQGGTTAIGTVDLAINNAAVRIEYTETTNATTGDVTKSMAIVSGIVVRAFSTADNQELTALRRVIWPLADSVSLITINGVPMGQIAQPLKIRLDGVPATSVRFEVTSTYNIDGTGDIIGSGSANANIPASTPDNPTLVTVNMLR